MEKITLNQLTQGQVATVKKVGGEKALRKRLMDMGIIKGAAIEMVKVAPLGDPIAYKIRGYQIALRQSEAKLIEIEF